MYDGQNLRTTLYMLNQRIIRQADEARERKPRSECSVCHRLTDDGATRCGLHPQEGA